MREWATKGVRTGFAISQVHAPYYHYGKEQIEAGGEEFDRWLAAHDREVKAEAWDEGHKTSWRRGPDDCLCGARASIECACGRYGNGELLSLHDNPYRKEADRA